jgi:hypothetical protein
LNSTSREQLLDELATTLLRRVCRRAAADELERLARALTDREAIVADCERIKRRYAEVDQTDGYKDAFYEIAKLLDMTAMPISPREAFETVMLPRLRELVSREAASAEKTTGSHFPPPGLV